MNVWRKSPFSGNYNVMDLPVTESSLNHYETSGEYIQNVFPHLNADQREFIKTGITPQEWTEKFGLEE